MMGSEALGQFQIGSVVKRAGLDPRKANCQLQEHNWVQINYFHKAIKI